MHLIFPTGRWDTIKSSEHDYKSPEKKEIQAKKNQYRAMFTNST